MFDFSEFFKPIPSNGPIVLAAVIGLTTFLGKAGVKGLAQLISALILGILFGGAFQIAALGTPRTFGEWFAVVIYGIMMGLFASGIYETGKKIAEDAAVKALGKVR